LNIEHKGSSVVWQAIFSFGVMEGLRSSSGYSTGKNRTNYGKNSRIW